MPPRWLPWAAVVATGWLALFPIGSVDAYYHLATGKRILETRTIPTRGVGSATFGNAPWHDNEWGFQALAAAIGRSTSEPGSGVVVLTPAGRVGLIVFRALACAATMALLALTMMRAGASPALAACGAWLAAFLTFGNLFWDIRPQIVSYLAFALVADLLERFRTGSRRALPAALLVIALWSSFHGAVVLGVVLVACEAAGAWMERAEGRGLLTWATALAPLAACANPLGWRQVAYAVDYARHPEIFAGNNEWTRPDLLHLPLLVLTVALLVVAVAAGARLRAGQLLRVAAFGALFFSAIRHLPFFVLVLVPLTVAALREVSRLGGWRRRLVPRGLVEVAFVAAIVVALSGARQIGLVPRFAERPSRPLPESQVRFLARHGIEGAGFNAYRFGGFLMFRLYPQERVVMDGRNDLYRAFRWETYEPILHARPGWEGKWNDLVARHGIGWVLVDATDRLAAQLAEMPAWLRVPDASSACVLYIADTPANRFAIGSTR